MCGPNESLASGQLLPQRATILRSLRAFLLNVVRDNCAEYFAVEEQPLAGATNSGQFRLFFNAISALEVALTRAWRVEAHPGGRDSFLALLAEAEPSLRVVHRVATTIHDHFELECSNATPSVTDADPRGFERSMMTEASSSVRAAFAFWTDYALSLDEELGGA